MGLSLFILLSFLALSVRANEIEIGGKTIDTSPVDQLDSDGRYLRAAVATIAKVTDLKKLDKYVQSKNIDAVKRIRRQIDGITGTLDDADRNSYGQLESGKRQHTTAPTLNKLAQALACDANELLKAGKSRSAK